MANGLKKDKIYMQKFLKCMQFFNIHFFMNFLKTPIIFAYCVICDFKCFGPNSSLRVECNYLGKSDVRKSVKATKWREE